ncbi:hypothetical protein D0Z07_1617 [Hyphodiscus hymeniophilus]|uniref:Uncharacterized protein n=1 Tax=Hyphodiscus hymeniophilus TaxID=353542 RepID=A0A9P6VNP6_9HELO|nr:hypothetical protein D0Z07_1617 [Hyphodiscus hymeniophilus]
MVALQQNRVQQLALSKQLLMEFAATLLIRCEKSLDLLESLILYNVWQYYYTPENPHSQSTAVMQLAISVVYDLGLHKPFRENEGPGMMPESSALAADNTKELKRSSEERRAYLSTFIISSSLSSCMKKMDGLDHNPYLDYTCQFLFEAAEYQSDLILVFMARTQALVASMNRALQYNLVAGSVDIKAPLSMQAKSAKADLQSYLMALPSNIQEHDLVRRTYHNAEVFFYEPCLHRSSFLSNQNSQRLDMLWACTIAAKSILDNFLSLPISLCNSMSIITIAQVGFAISTAFKLSFIEIPGWDLGQVRETLNFPEFSAQVISHFVQAGAQIDNCQAVPVKRSFCTGGSLALRRIKASYEAKVAAEGAKGQQEEQTALPGIDEIPAGGKIDYFDDTYLMSDWPWEGIMDEFMQE